MRPHDVIHDDHVDTAGPPANFEPRRHPVIATHFYGIPRPWRHAGTIVAKIVADLSHRDRSDKAQAARRDTPRQVSA